MNFLERGTVFSKTAINNKTLSTKSAIASSIDLEDALQVIDTTGNINHSFLLNYEDNNDATFYNLVVHQNSKEDVPDAYVLKYEIEENYLPLFIDSSYNFSNFHGTIKRYSLINFINNSSSKTASSKSRQSFGVDDCICEETIVSGRGSSSGSGSGLSEPVAGNSTDQSGSGSGSGLPDGGGITCISEIIVVECDAGGGHTGGGQGCTSDTFEGSTIVRTTCSDGSVTDVVSNKVASTKIEDDCLNPCPDKELGEVGVLKPLPSFEDIAAALGYTKRYEGSEEYALLLNNIDVYADVRLFLMQNDFSPESLEFAKSAINAILNNGEVDFVNEIIKDSSFIGTKADCVLNALIASGNNLFKKISQAFTDGKSKFKLRFTTYNDSTDDAEARTGLPDSNGIISIRFNQANTMNSTALDLATNILHESIHAELHRIKLSNNASPNSLPSNQYNWYVKIWENYEFIYDGQGEVASAAEHYYMSYYLIDPISQGLREFDNNTHPLDNYKFYAWSGLDNYGIEAGLITNAEITNLANLSSIIESDGHTNQCD